MAGLDIPSATGLIHTVVNADTRQFDAALDKSAARAVAFDATTTRTFQNLQKTSATTGKSAQVATAGLASAQQTAQRFNATATTLAVVARGLGLAFAAAGSLVGAAGFVGAAGLALSEAAALETELLTLNAVIVATGSSAGRTVDDINALASSIANATLATDNSVRRAAAQLLTFRSVAGETFDQALRLAQDLAATGFGSIESAAVSLGMALENPEEGLLRLRRVGVTFTEAQKELIKTLIETGRQAEAQRVILAAVAQQVGGAGSAQASGLTGAFHTLKEAVADTFANFGSYVAEAFGLNENLRALAETIGLFNRRNAPQTHADTLANLGEEYDRIAVRYAKANDELEKLLTVQARGEVLTTSETRRIAQLNRELDVYDKKLADIAGSIANVQAAQSMQQGEASTKAVIAEYQAQQERIAGVVTELNKQTDALKGTELAERQLAAAKKAGAFVVVNGISVLSEEGKAIYGQVAAIEKLAFARSQLNTTYAGLDNFQQSLMTTEQLEIESNARRLEQIRAFQAAGYVTQTEAQSLLEQEFYRHSARMKQIAIDQSAGVTEAQTGAFQAGVALLQQLGGKSKAAAIAAIAVNTALQAAQTIQNTHAAAVRALAELGPIAGPPAAATIEAWGAAQVAAIVAAGALQIGSSRASLSGGGSVSTSGSAGSSTSTATAAAAPAETQQVRAVEIQLRGGVSYSNDEMRELIRRLNEQTSNGAVLISTKTI